MAGLSHRPVDDCRGTAGAAAAGVCLQPGADIHTSRAGGVCGLSGSHRDAADSGAPRPTLPRYRTALAAFDRGGHSGGLRSAAAAPRHHELHTLVRIAHPDGGRAGHAHTGPGHHGSGHLAALAVGLVDGRSIVKRRRATLPAKCPHRHRLLCGELSGAPTLCQAGGRAGSGRAQPHEGAGADADQHPGDRALE